MKQPNGLISVLLDKTASEAERDDAAMDLGLFPEHQALEALIQIALDPSQDEDLGDVCGESIARIWVSLDQMDLEVFNNLAKASKREAFDFIESQKNEWVSKYHLTA